MDFRNANSNYTIPNLPTPPPPPTPLERIANALERIAVALEDANRWNHPDAYEQKMQRERERVLAEQMLYDMGNWRSPRV
ncbi:MAG: hypothetical protein AAF702_22840 [Chloroflexota bacterium]